jgi:flagellar assembly factor FliW
MKQQTAVEWLWRWINDNQEATIEEGIKAFEQAKQMEKEQMKEMYLKGIENYDPTFKRKSQWTAVDNSTKLVK